jgi:hypothetical protein
LANVATGGDTARANAPLRVPFVFSITSRHGGKILVSGQRTPKQNAPEPILARRFSVKQPAAIIFHDLSFEHH